LFSFLPASSANFFSSATLAARCSSLSGGHAPDRTLPTICGPAATFPSPSPPAPSAGTLVEGSDGVSFFSATACFASSTCAWSFGSSLTALSNARCAKDSPPSTRSIVRPTSTQSSPPALGPTIADIT
jgi:hypothetical protein